MTWEAIGAIGELTGAVAVVLTIFYLAVQVRHAQRALATDKSVSVAQIYVDVTKKNTALNLMSLEVVPLIKKVDEGDNLSDEDFYRIFVYFIEMENLLVAIKSVSEMARYDLHWEEVVRQRAKNHFASGIGRTFLKTFPPPDSEIAEVLESALENAGSRDDPVGRLKAAHEESRRIT